MTWFKLDDQLPDHPKMLSAGPDAAWLWVCGGCYCSRHLTDGTIPKEAVGRLTGQRQPFKLAARLVDAGLWIDRGDSYEMHGFLDYNPSRESVENDRRKARERRQKFGRTSGERRANVTNPDPTRPDVPTEHKNPRKQKPPVDYLPSEAQAEYADSHGLTLEEERVAWIDWCDANGRTYADVGKGFSTWLRNAVKFNGNGHKKPVAVAVAEPARCTKCAGTTRISRNGQLVPCVCIGGRTRGESD